MERKGTVKGDKNDLQTMLYSYTKFGHLLALILRSSFLDQEISYEGRKASINKAAMLKKEKELQSVNSKIFSLLDSAFLRIEEDTRSTVIFYSQFWRKCREKRAFDSLVKHIAKTAHSNNPLVDMRGLLERAMDLAVTDKKAREKLVHLWNETLEDLDEETKALVWFQMKSNTERRFEDNKIFLTREYEETRFRHRNDYERIVVEGKCEKCGTGPAVLPFLEYRKRYVYVGPSNPVQVDCPRCESVNGLSIQGLNV
jgi:hypothetical protein